MYSGSRISTDWGLSPPLCGFWRGWARRDRTPCLKLCQTLNGQWPHLTIEWARCCHLVTYLLRIPLTFIKSGKCSGRTLGSKGSHQWYTKDSGNALTVFGSVYVLRTPYTFTEQQSLGLGTSNGDASIAIRLDINNQAHIGAKEKEKGKSTHRKTRTWTLPFLTAADQIVHTFWVADGVPCSH